MILSADVNGTVATETVLATPCVVVEVMRVFLRKCVHIYIIYIYIIIIMKKHVRCVERYTIKNVFKEYDEEEDDGEWNMKRGIRYGRKRRIGNVEKEGEVFDLVKGVTEEYEIRHWFYEGKEKEKEKEGKCNCNCNCSCLKEMVLGIERVGFSIGGKESNNNNQHNNNDINEYDNEGSKWSSEHMKVDKSITCVNIERGISGSGNNSNYNGLNELHETAMSSNNNNNTYRNHNTTMNNCYQRYSQPMSSSLIDSVNSNKHNKLKSSKKMYQYNYEQQQQHQHSQLKVMLTKNKSFNDLTILERKTKTSTLPVDPYVNNNSFHCGNIIYPISNVDYLKTEQMKRIHTLLFTKHTNTLNLRKKYNQI